MSFKEQGEWVALAGIGGTFAAYLAVVLGRAGGAPVADVSYLSAMLWAIGLGIALTVVGHIAVVVATARPGEPDRTRVDARDRDINRSGEHVGGVVLAAAMVVPFSLAMAEVDPFWIANAMYAAFVLATLVGTSVKLVGYRRGL